MPFNGGMQHVLTDRFSQLRSLAARLISYRWFETFIISVIVVNAITLGMETSPTIMASAGSVLKALDTIFLTIFVVELLARMLAYGRRFWSDPWCWFDFIIVGISLVPQSGNLSVLRALRIMRALRLISVVPSLRRVVSSLLLAIPSMGAIGILLVLINYVFAVMATKLYGAQFPELFGTIGASLFTLFQVMTLEGWAMEVVRPVMAKYPWAWAFFLPYIFIVVFAVLNLFIGIIVDAMSRQAEVAKKEKAGEGNAKDKDADEAVIEITKSEYNHLLAEIGNLRSDVQRLHDGSARFKDTSPPGGVAD